MVTAIANPAAQIDFSSPEQLQLNEGRIRP